MEAIMLTKGKNSKFRAVKYVAMVLALVAVLAFCFTSCGTPEVLSAEYLAGTLEKTQYNAGETFDCTGAQMKVTYVNGDVNNVAITAEMVGEVTLSFGMTSVEATYSENGKQIKCLIPVTVIDPLATEKSAAIAAINAKDAVKNGDKGVAAMVAEYTNKINAASSKDAITALNTEFEAELADYTQAKADALARVELTDKQLTDKGLYEQFLLDVKNAQKLAIANIKAAISKEAADDIADGFEDLIAKKLAEQSFYEKDEDGQIDQKIALIKLINKYMKKAEGYIVTIEANPAAEGVLSALQEEKLEVYELAVIALDLLKEEVRLAINLGKVEEDLNDIIDDLKTPLDDIYALIENGHVVKPAPYTETGDLAENDDTKTLIANYDKLYADAEELFGVAGAAKEAKAYKYDFEKSAIDLVKVFDAIKAKRADLDTKQSAIATLNATVSAWGENNVPMVAAIKSAWNELETWGTAAITVDDKDIVFKASTDKGMFESFEIDYVSSETASQDATGYEGKYAVDAWSDYYIDKAYLTTYFFPALDKLIKADEDARKEIGDFDGLVAAMAPIVYTHDKNVDANSRIALAEAAYTAIVTKYAPDAENDAILGEKLKAAHDKITAARTAYNKLVSDAADLIDLIKALPEANKIVIKDYDELDADLNKVGKLAKAYAAWLAFRDANMYEDGNGVKHYFTDVIDDADNNSETTDDQYSAQLLACMKAYVELKFTEEVKVYGNITVAKAYTQAIDETDETIDTVFRYALTEKKAELLNNLPKFDESAYAEATLLNIMDILSASLTESKAAAKGLANQFVEFYNNHELKTEAMDDLVAFQ